MAAKIIAFLITMLVNITAGVVVFFGMMLAMNGYHESDANYGFIAYIALAMIVTILMSLAAAVFVHILKKKQYNAFVSVLISVVGFSVVGVVLKITCGVIGVGIAEFVRVNF
jgi:hypothetical protein